MDSGLSKNDPYRGMSSARDEYMPSFKPPTLGGNKKKNDFLGVDKKQKNNDAANDLKNAEDKAAGGQNDGAPQEGLAGANANEANAKGFYSGSGKQRAKSGKKQSGFKGILKKGGPMGVVTAIIMLVAGFMGGAQSMMPFAIGEMFIEKFNSIGVSSTVASDSWLDMQLNLGVRTEALETGQTEGTYAFSEHQVGEFKRNGIIVVNEPTITALLYLKDGTYIPVVGSEALKNKSTSEIISTIKSASGLNNIGSPISASEALSDSDFKTPYTTASKTWRGGSSGWFDGMMSKVTDVKLGIRRNRWLNFSLAKLKGMNEDIDAVVKAYNETAAANTGQVDAGDDRGSQEYEEIKEFTETDEDGTVNTYYDWDSEERQIDGTTYFANGEDGDNNIIYTNRPNAALIEENVGVKKEYGIDPQTIEEDFRAFDGSNVDVEAEKNKLVDNFLGVSDDKMNGLKSEEAVSKALKAKAVKAAATAQKAASVTCGLTKALIAIYITVSAYQTVQFLNQTTGYLEATDKAKAGDGDGSPINEYNNNLTTLTPTTDRDGNVVEGREMRSGMDSQGMSWLFGSSFKIDNDDPSVQNTNIESVMGNLGGIFGGVFSKISSLGKAYNACLIAQIVGNTVDTVMTIASAGSAKIAQEIFQSVKGVVISTAVMIGIAIVLPIIIKQVTKLVIKDVATEWFGEDLGNAMVSGASKYLGGNGTSGGQSPGSKAKVLAYLNTQETVIADEAEYQRKVRSPFDMRSQYTFLGSLAYSVLPMAYSGGGIMHTISNVSNLTTTSIASIMPTAHAIDSQSAMNSEGNCPLLESVVENENDDDGVAITGDAYCNPYVITDVDTIKESPDQISKKVHSMGGEEKNFDENGNIQKGSNLAKYVTYCGQRTSPYGIQDAAIAGDVTGQNSAKTILGYVPVVGSVIGIYNDGSEMKNMPWISGAACVASDENDLWEENQYYQRYAENERLLENMNPGYKSTVTAYVEQYYKENPIDNSFEGTLARFSGLTKEEVSDTLALIEYYQFLENYRPEDRLAFGKPLFEKKKEIRFDNNNKLARNSAAILLNLITFADVRNRNFAV